MKNPFPPILTRNLAEPAVMGDSASPVPEPLSRASLERVVASVTFARAEQLRQLLNWLGDRSLAANRIAPSEKEIAESVLNRQDFDPQTDSLVRKEMSRLREKLSRYYRVEGIQDEIQIDADGGYLLGFQWSGKASATGRSCWLVLPFRTSPEMTESSEELHDGLLMGLSERGGPELVAPTTALAYRGRVGDVRQFAAECSADFIVEGRLSRQKESMEATAWLVDGRSGRAQRSKRIAGADPADLARAATAWLLEGDPAD